MFKKASLFITSKSISIGLSLFLISVFGYFVGCSDSELKKNSSGVTPAARPTSAEIDVNSPVADKDLSESLTKLRDKIASEHCEDNTDYLTWLESLQCRLIEQNVYWDSKYLYKNIESDDKDYDSSCQAMRKKHTKEFFLGVDSVKADVVGYLQTKCNHYVEAAIKKKYPNEEYKEDDYKIPDNLENELLDIVQTNQKITEDSKKALYSLNKSCSEDLDKWSLDDDSITDKKIKATEDQEHKEYFKIRYLYPAKYKEPPSNPAKPVMYEKIAKRWGIIYSLGNMKKFDNIDPDQPKQFKKDYFYGKQGVHERKYEDGYLGSSSLATFASHIGYDNFIDFGDDVDPVLQRQLIRSCIEVGGKQLTEPYKFLADDNQDTKLSFGQKYDEDGQKASILGEDLSKKLELTDAVCDTEGNKALDSTVTLNSHDPLPADDKIYQATFDLKFLGGISNNYIKSRCNADAVGDRCAFQDNLVIYTKIGSIKEPDCAFDTGFHGKIKYLNLDTLKVKGQSDNGYQKVCKFMIRINKGNYTSSDPNYNRMNSDKMNNILDDIFPQDTNRKCSKGVHYIDLCGAQIKDFIDKSTSSEKPAGSLEKKYDTYCQ